MKLEELNISMIIARKPSIKSTEFSIWYENDWVIKKMNLIKGSDEEMVDINEVYEIFCKLNQSDSYFLKFPKI